jgi:hypothetical protein
MSDGFTGGAATAASTLFECAKCNETIDSSAITCRFCGAMIDREAALKGAAVLAKVNQACSDAKYIASTAVAIPIAFVVRLVPFFGMIGLVAFYGLLLLVPFWTARWWLRFGKLDSADPEYRSSRNTVRTVGIVVSVAFAIFMVYPLMAGIFHLYHPTVR